MPRYYFDTRDDDKFIPDDDGIVLADISAAKTAAAMSLAELAKDALPGCDRRTMVVEVRNESRMVLRTLLQFEAILLAH